MTEDLAHFLDHLKHHLTTLEQSLAVDDIAQAARESQLLNRYAMGLQASLLNEQMNRVWNNGSKEGMGIKAILDAEISKNDRPEPGDNKTIKIDPETPQING